MGGALNFLISDLRQFQKKWDKIFNYLFPHDFEKTIAVTRFEPSETLVILSSNPNSPLKTKFLKKITFTKEHFHTIKQSKKYYESSDSPFHPIRSRTGRKTAIHHCVIYPIHHSDQRLFGFLVALSHIPDKYFPYFVLNSLKEWIAQDLELLHLKVNFKRIKEQHENLDFFQSSLLLETREPARMISGFLKLLNKKFKLQKKFSGDCCNFFDYTLNASQELERRLDALLYIHKFSDPPFIKNIDLNEVLAKTLNSLEEDILNARAIIKSDLLPVIKGNFHYLFVLFKNLLENSLQFRREGIHPHISIQVKKKKNSILIKILDNGIGISQENHQFVFLPFKKINTQNSSRLGIGLTLCKKIITGLQGKIWIESEPGKGSCFCLTFPFTKT
jgi:signal transduction histidine kinase